MTSPEPISGDLDPARLTAVLQVLPVAAALFRRDGMAVAINSLGEELFVHEAQAALQAQHWRVMLRPFGDAATDAMAAVEATQAVADVIGADRTSVRLSPNGETWGVDDSNPTPLFVAAAQALSAIGIGFLELKEHRATGTYAVTDVPRQSPYIRQHFAGPLILNSDYDAPRAIADLDSGLADAISFGRSFLANPDLVRRLREGARLNAANPATFYTQGREGYLDYPTLDAAQAAA